ncbi:MAG: hypothetical protein AB7L13_11265 [Acidimicrobiia bacterium]
MLLNILTVVVLAYFATRLVGGFRTATRGHGKARALRIVQGIRWRHVWPVPFVLTGVIGTAIALIQVPGLDFGWWTAIGGTGNPVTGGTDRTTGTVFEWLIPLVFLSLLLPALPLFAEAEERMFRLGAERWTPRHRLYKVLQFGLVHALIGIPLGVALALSIGGAYFMARYLAEWHRTGDPLAATLESTRAHTAYNGTIIALFLLSLVLSVVIG